MPQASNAASMSRSRLSFADVAGCTRVEARVTNAGGSSTPVNGRTAP